MVSTSFYNPTRSSAIFPRVFAFFRHNYRAFREHFSNASSYNPSLGRARPLQGAAPKVKTPKPDMFCHGGTWLVEACLMVIPGWQMAVHGQ
jgi:hypothetical protein